VGGRAETDSPCPAISASLFQNLFKRCRWLTQRLVGLMSDRIREVTRLEQQQDRLASFGKALGRACARTEQSGIPPRSAPPANCATLLKKIKDASVDLGKRDLSPAQKLEIEKLEASFTQSDVVPPDALTMSDLEEQIDSLVAEPWTG